MLITLHVVMGFREREDLAAAIEHMGGAEG